MILRVDGKYVSKCDNLGRVRGRDGATPIRPVSLEDAASFAVQVLLVRGERSNILAPDAAERFAAAIPDSQLVTVPNCGHNVHSQNTPGFLEAIAPFIAGLPG
jgi:pimeloyl-ACP methyl ester carboxylesterase